MNSRKDREHVEEFKKFMKIIKDKQVRLILQDEVKIIEDDKNLLDK